MGDLDVESAQLLVAQERLLPVVAFHLQQAMEKYLKGFLLSTGWTLQRIHDLEPLVYEAIARDRDFASFLAPCQRITEYYIESRYPTGVQTTLARDVLLSDLDTVRALAELVQGKLSRSPRVSGS